jgi:hypothetical protein
LERPKNRWFFLLCFGSNMSEKYELTEYLPTYCIVICTWNIFLVCSYFLIIHQLSRQIWWWCVLYVDTWLFQNIFYNSNTGDISGRFK